ncbi:MAG TPA: TadE/TadG family type IV pilus assembly protein [Tepidisphaeraceae bacterium]|nr:TadE/TadG family type IV pilus assembly protein [Tepidisphaeraceae bacterium]
MFGAEMVLVKRHGGFLSKGRVRRGAVLIEAVIVLPVLLLLLFGIIEFGYCFYVLHTMKGAAWAGVRVAIIQNTDSMDATSRVKAAVSRLMGNTGLAGNEYTTTIQGEVDPFYAAQRGAKITVTIECTWGTVGVRPMQLIDANKILRVEAVMLKE